MGGAFCLFLFIFMIIKKCSLMFLPVSLPESYSVIESVLETAFKLYSIISLNV